MKQDKKNILWYRNPAKEWTDALPLGNGRIGAMVYGGTGAEAIQIDESSFWSGAPSDRNNRPGTRELMEKIRRALLMRDYETADTLGHDFVGNKNQYGTNMPVGELKLRISEIPAEAVCENYVRYLDLAAAIAGTEFDYAGRHFRRECFVSNPLQAVFVKVESDKRFSMEIRYDGIGNNTAITDFDEGYARIMGDALETLHSDGKHGVHLEGCLKVISDGTLSFSEAKGERSFCGDAQKEGGALQVRNASMVCLILDLETTMFQKDPYQAAKERVKKAESQDYESCQKAHEADVRKLFDRMDISLGQEERKEIPTDERIKAAAMGQEDLSLYALMYQFGRYLMIASSRGDSPLPTHMGGIWNDNIYNRIDCTQDMHIDMNLQMQYWASALCNLPECYQPFFGYLENVLVPSGERTAREAYGAGGWTAHVVSNPWGFTSLGWGYNWGAWSLGGVWCAALVWDYYEYTKDRDFLEKRGFDILEGAVRFTADYVFWDEKNGYYMTGPSYSPENQFSVNGKNYFLALSNTCDVVLIREILDIYGKACRALGRPEDALQRKVKEILEKLPPCRIGKKGQLQEWFYDFEEPIPNHRHTSHLLGLYPFNQIEPQRQPELAQAAREGIRIRYRNFEVTSWGMNMLIGYYARLCDGEAALGILRDIFAKIVKTNMASVMSDGTTMWQGTWELDGNTGLTAAMTEMLVQSTQNSITLLPALPEEWKSGYLCGILLKGKRTADIYWKDGKLEKAVIEARSCGNKTDEENWCEIRYQGRSKGWKAVPGTRLVITENKWEEQEV